MLNVDLDQIFSGTILIVTPHMDDEALACGGLIASLIEKKNIHILYATDGMKSPSPVMPGIDAISPDLGEVRIKESITAMAFLGVPEENLHFLRLPEGQLRKNKSVLKGLLFEHIKVIDPKYIFIPFRYDRHPDHLVVNHVITEGLKQCRFQAQLMEYFVYHRWRLLPKKDIRAYIKRDYLLVVDILDVSKKKRLALDIYKSQTSIYYSWQTRPILGSNLLDEDSTKAENFLFHHPSTPGASIFNSTILWIKIAHRLEWILKDWKYYAVTFINRALRNSVRNAR